MKRILFTLLLFIIMNTSILSKTIWKDKNIYSSEGNLKVGNIIIINIKDLSDLKFNLSLSNKNSSDISSKPDAVITGFLPKVTASRKINNDDKTQFSGKGQISFSLASRITRIVGGIYEISGSKTYSFSGVINIITVRGFVEPALIKGRTVDSTNVADFSLEIRGIKQGINLKRDELKEGEKADTNLTEQEKQQIILDYLQKMIRELTR